MTEFALLDQNLKQGICFILKKNFVVVFEENRCAQTMAAGPFVFGNLLCSAKSPKVSRKSHQNRLEVFISKCMHRNQKYLSQKVLCSDTNDLCRRDIYILSLQTHIIHSTNFEILSVKQCFEGLIEGYFCKRLEKEEFDLKS